MIIFLPIVIQETGGTSSFARNFKQEMEARGHEVSFTFQPEYDVLLVVASSSLRHLAHAKRYKRIIIQRLDGVHYPTTIAGWLYPWYNFPLWLTRQFADVTIYQSNYARYCCEKFLGRAQSTQEHVIYNGVDTDLFTLPPSLSHEGGNPTFLTAQRFRRRDQLEVLVKAVQIYRERYHGSATLVIAGDFHGEAEVLPKEYGKISWIKFLGPLAHEELAQRLRRTDAFLYCHPNSSCPNNVLEAMAAGVPIAGVADGAMPEIVQPGWNGELIPAPGDGFFKPRQLDLSLLADNLHTILRKRERYAAASRQRAVERFSLQRMIDSYLTVLDRRSDT